MRHLLEGEVSETYWIEHLRREVYNKNKIMPMSDQQRS